MKKIRTRVILTAKDWQAIYNALGLCIELYPGGTFAPSMRRVVGKIGVDGMAARDRGVAPVTTRSTPRAPRF